MKRKKFLGREFAFSGDISHDIVFFPGSDFDVLEAPEEDSVGVGRGRRNGFIGDDRVRNNGNRSGNWNVGVGYLVVMVVTPRIPGGVATFVPSIGRCLPFAGLVVLLPALIVVHDRRGRRGATRWESVGMSRRRRPNGRRTVGTHRANGSDDHF